MKESRALRKPAPSRSPVWVLMGFRRQVVMCVYVTARSGVVMSARRRNASTDSIMPTSAWTT